MSALRTFLSWPAGASLLYLVSAACLLGGAALVLAPGSADEQRLVERLALLGTVHLYVGMLAGLAALLCRWRPGNGDAVALLVLLALFLPGMEAGLSLIATHRPWLALGLGVGGLALATGVLLAVQWRVTGPWSRWLLLPLALIQVWHAVSPGLLGLVYQDVATPEPLVRGWLPGWWAVCLGALALAPAAWRARSARDARPLVHGEGLRWILVLVALVAGALHQFLLTYSLNLGVSGWDLAGLGVVLLLLGDILLCRWPLLPVPWITAAHLAAAVVLVGAAHSGDVLGRTDGAYGISALPCWPPLLLAAGAAGLGVLAALRRSTGGALVAWMWLLGALLTWNMVDGRLDLRTGLGGVFVLCAFLVAWARPHPCLWLALLVLLVAGVSHPSPWPALIASTAVLVRAWRLESVALALLVVLPLGRHAWDLVAAAIATLGGWLGILAAFTLLALGALASWRRAQGRPPPGGGMLVPAGGPLADAADAKPVMQGCAPPVDATAPDGAASAATATPAAPTTTAGSSSSARLRLVQLTEDQTPPATPILPA